MANEFIKTAFTDRQQRLNLAVRQNQREMVDNMDGLIHSLNDTNERRWQDMLRTIINCVALRRKCDGHVGRFLNANYPHWTEKKRKHITAQCTYSRKIFMNWDVIVSNLTKPNMSHVNPQLFTIRKLYDATNPAWCERERRQNGAEIPQTRSSTIEQEYDEEKLLAIFEFTNQTGIMRDIDFDSDQLDHFVNKYKSLLAQYAASQ